MAAVVDQLPSVVSFLWLGRGGETAPGLYTVLHCRGLHVVVVVVYSFGLFLFSFASWLECCQCFDRRQPEFVRIK